MGRSGRIALAKSSFGLFLFVSLLFTSLLVASFHPFGLHGHQATVLLHGIKNALSGGFPAHHPEIDRLLRMQKLATRMREDSETGGAVEVGASVPRGGGLDRQPRKLCCVARELRGGGLRTGRARLTD